MNRKTCALCKNFVWALAVLLEALGLYGVHGGAQPDGVPNPGNPTVSPLPSTTPPEIMKPVPLSELKSADAVFNELDVGQRGYVTRQETKDLVGFGNAFRAVDTKGSGKLTREQFRKAWALYQQAVKK